MIRRVVSVSSRLVLASTPLDLVAHSRCFHMPPVALWCCCSCRLSSSSSSSPSSTSSPSTPAKAGEYTFEDFLNDDDIVAPRKVLPVSVAEEGSVGKSSDTRPSNLEEVSRSNPKAQQQTQNQVQQHRQQQQRNLPPAFRAPHSLSEFLVRCDTLVVEAKRHAKDPVHQARLRTFWNSHVSRAVEMNTRNGHDLACIALAGRAFGLVIPSRREEDRNAVYTGWSLLQRYTNMTRCSDLVVALRLLVQSQPSLSSADDIHSGGTVISAATPSPVHREDLSAIPKPKSLMYDEVADPTCAAASTAHSISTRHQNLIQLHSKHQKFAMQCIRHYFVELEDGATGGSTIRCPLGDYSSILDVLIILDHFTDSMVPSRRASNSSSNSSSIGSSSSSATSGGGTAASGTAADHNCSVSSNKWTTTRSNWLAPPAHLSDKMWATVGDVHKHAVEKCARTLSFSHLIHCLIAAKRLFVRCRILHNLAVKEDRRWMTSKGAQRHTKYVEALRAAARDIRGGASCLIGAVLKQIQDSGGKKFVNSFHFSELVVAADAMQFLALPPSAQQQQLQEKEEEQCVEARSLLGRIFQERTEKKTLDPSTSAETSTSSSSSSSPAVHWEFPLATHKKLSAILGLLGQ